MNARPRAFSALAPVNSLPPGTRLHGYEIRSVIGEGGFGIVYLAVDTMLEREVAIKEYLPVSHAVRRGELEVQVRSQAHETLFEKGMRSFISEAQTLARFRHPALVEVLQFWEGNGTAYMVMPYYRGQTLRDMVQRGIRIDSEAELLAILQPVLSGLSVMHAADCYHRDISSDNILLLDSGAPVLLDFGAARNSLVDAGDASTIILKPGFAPIEQYAGDQTAAPEGPWTDIYALSAVAFQLITGDMPTASVARIMNDPLVPLARREIAGFSRGLLRAIDQGMAVRPEDRPRSAADFEYLLLNPVVDEVPEPSWPVDAAGGQPAAAATGQAGAVSGDAPVRRAPAAAARPGWRLPLAAVAAVVALVVVGMMYIVYGGGPAPVAESVATVAATPAPAQSPLPAPVPAPVVASPTPPPIATVDTTASVVAPTRRVPIVPEPPAEASPEPAAVMPPTAEEPPVLADATPADEDIAVPVPEPDDTVVQPMEAPQPDMVAVVPVPAALPTPPPPPATQASATSAVEPSASGPIAAFAATVDWTDELAGQITDAPSITELADAPDIWSSADWTYVATERSDAPAEPALPNYGYLVVSVQPWGRVYINGEFIAIVPPTMRFPALVGTHRVEIRNESQPAYSAQVTIEPGQSVSLSHNFAPPPDDASVAAAAPDTAAPADGTDDE